MRKLEGDLIANKHKVAIVVGRFNEFIGSKLLEGAVDGLVRHGVELDHITVVHVPGAYELPLISKKLAKQNMYDAIICLGAVIRGATTHYELVTNEVAKGLASVSLDTEIPVIFGVLTTESIEQAIERAGTKAGNKGFEAALSAIEMINLIQQIQ